MKTEPRLQPAEKPRQASAASQTHEMPQRGCAHPHPVLPPLPRSSASKQQRRDPLRSAKLIGICREGRGRESGGSRDIYSRVRTGTGGTLRRAARARGASSIRASQSSALRAAAGLSCCARGGEALARRRKVARRVVRRARRQGVAPSAREAWEGEGQTRGWFYLCGLSLRAGRSIAARASSCGDRRELARGGAAFSHAPVLRVLRPCCEQLGVVKRVVLLLLRKLVQVLRAAAAVGGREERGGREVRVRIRSFG